MLSASHALKGLKSGANRSQREDPLALSPRWTTEDEAPPIELFFVLRERLGSGDWQLIARVEPLC